MPSATLLLLLSVFVSLSFARPEFRMQIPNGLAADRGGTGITCAQLGHKKCVSGAPRNPFGLDFKAAGLKWTKSLCKKDSDGDGLTNGEELGDPCCVWRPGKKPARTTVLSHPGEKGQDGARNAPRCGVSAPNRAGKCSGMTDTFTVACVCFAVVTGKVKVKSKNDTLKSCGKLFGNAKKIRGFEFTCGRFRSKKGLNKKKIGQAVNVVERCS